MLGTGESGAESLWSRIDFFDAEQGETDTRAADIDDRIDRANLVKCTSLTVVPWTLPRPR